MSARERFLSLVRAQQLDPDRAASESWWSPALECAALEQIARLQEERLVAAYEYLYECSPYYRQRFERAGLRSGSIRSLDDLHRIPVTRKLDWIPDIESHSPWGTFSPLSEEQWRRDGWMIFSTSGTTQKPRLFRHTHHDRRLWAWMCARALWSYGARPGMTAMNCFYYGTSVAAWGMHHGLELLGCSLVPGGPMPTERRAMLIELARPQILLGTPSAMLTLGRRMLELGIEPRAAGVEIIVCAGEPGAAVSATKKRLSAMWDARIHDDFGCTEVAHGPLGYTCPYQADQDEVGVHLMEDCFIVEVLDPQTLEPVPPGARGTLVVSNLYSEAACFLRFDMGDWVSVASGNCPCGRTHRLAMGGLVGRNDHCLKIKGLQFFPSTFEAAVRSIDGLGDEYRVEVRDSGGFAERAHGDEVHIVVELCSGSVLDRRDVEGRLRGMLGISVNVELHEPGTLPRTEGKGARFVDRRAPRDERGTS